METMETMKERAEKGAMRMEGKAAKMIDKAASSIPSSTFVMLAGGAVVGSLVLKLFGRSSTANFVGQWAPTFLMLAVYDKIVKVLGSERGGAGASSSY